MKKLLMFYSCLIVSIFSACSSKENTKTTPTVNMINMEDKDTQISTSKNIQLKFSEPVNNVNDSNIKLHQDNETGNTIPIGNIILSENNVYTFSPKKPLLENTTYYIVIDSGITNNFGNSIKKTFFNFTTGSFNTPTVDIMTPINNESNVNKNPIIKIKFSEKVNDVANNITLRENNENGEIVDIGGIIRGGDNVYTFGPNQPLLANTNYYLVINTGITNNTGDNIKKTVFQFTTIESDYPIVDIITPQNNSSKITRIPNIQIKFNQTVYNVNSNITLHKGNESGDIISIGNIILSDDNIYTFSPQNQLLEQTAYYVIIESAITNNFHNKLNKTIFKFTTDKFTAPIATLINPQENNKPVNPKPNIQIKFSENVKNVIDNITLHTDKSNDNIINLINLSISIDNVYTFSPQNPLLEQTTYVLFLESGIVDDSDNKLKPVSFKFTTGKFSIPKVTIKTPNNNQIIESKLPIIELQFSESINNFKDNINLYGDYQHTKAIPIESIIKKSNHVYQFKPKKPLSRTKSYYVVVESGITDNYNNHLEKAIFKFRVESKFIYLFNQYSKKIVVCHFKDYYNQITSCNNINDNTYTESIKTIKVLNNKYIYITYDNSISKCNINQENSNLLNCQSLNIKVTESLKPLDIAFNKDYFYIINDSDIDHIIKCNINKTNGNLSNCINTVYDEGDKSNFTYITLNNNYAFISSPDNLFKYEIDNNGNLTNYKKVYAKYYYIPIATYNIKNSNIAFSNNISYLSDNKNFYYCNFSDDNFSDDNFSNCKYKALDDYNNSPINIINNILIYPKDQNSIVSFTLESGIIKKNSKQIINIQ